MEITEETKFSSYEQEEWSHCISFPIQYDETNTKLAKKINSVT
jgi:hypothetical protein